MQKGETKVSGRTIARYKLGEYGLKRILYWFGIGFAN